MSGRCNHSPPCLCVTETCGVPCTAGQFTCANDCCLDPGLECDTVAQCSDGSDETNCDNCKHNAYGKPSFISILAHGIINAVSVDMMVMPNFNSSWSCLYQCTESSWFFSKFQWMSRKVIWHFTGFWPAISLRYCAYITTYFLRYRWNRCFEHLMSWRHTSDHA